MKRTLFATVGFGMLPLGRISFGFNADPDDQNGGGQQQGSDAPAAPEEPKSDEGNPPSAEPPVVNAGDTPAEDPPVNAEVVSEDATQEDVANATEAGESAVANDTDVDGATQNAPAGEQQENATP